MDETRKEKLQFWQPRGIESLRASNPSQLILTSVSKSPSQLELTISDEHENKLQIIYDQLCTAEFAVWHFAFDTHVGRSDLWVNDIDRPDNFSEHTPFFSKSSTGAASTNTVTRQSTKTSWTKWKSTYIAQETSFSSSSRNTSLELSEWTRLNQNL